MIGRLCPNDKSEAEQKLDMSPGDALGLALLTGCPLLFSDELAKQLGVPLSEGQTPELYLINDLLRREGIALPEGKNLRMGFSKTPMRDALLKEFKASLLGKAPPFCGLFEGRLNNLEFAHGFALQCIIPAISANIYYRHASGQKVPVNRACPEDGLRRAAKFTFFDSLCKFSDRFLL